MADGWTAAKGGIAGLLHYYAPGLWRTYGIPFDRLGGLCWWDVETMVRVVERESREAQQ